MRNLDIAIVDYGMGNLRSVYQAVHHVAGTSSVLVTSDPAEIMAASRVIFPGQGAMPDCMRELDLRGLRSAILHAAANKPFFGICIGMQLLLNHSEEGNTAGLGLIKGTVKRFSTHFSANGEKLKVPHMGWNQVYQTQAYQNHDIPNHDIPNHDIQNQVIQNQAHTIHEKPHALWADIADATRFYHVHSYYADPQDSALIAGETEYPQRFCSALAVNNIFATQFHVEKSAQAGLQLLENFVYWKP